MNLYLMLYTAAMLPALSNQITISQNLLFPIKLTTGVTFPVKCCLLSHMPSLYHGRDHDTQTSILKSQETTHGFTRHRNT